MRKARRWNNDSYKRSLLDSMLDRVVVDLFPSSDWPKRRRSGAVRPAAKPRRQSFALEAIEPRVLMSETPFSASQAAALTAGLQGLSTWADTLDHSGALAQSLPTYTQTDPNPAKIPDTLGDKVDVGTQVDTLLATPLKNYFAADPTPTLSELVTTLNAVPHVSVTGSATGSEIALTVQLDAPVAPTTGKIDVVDAANGIQAQTPLEVSVGEHLKFNFTFGLDLTPGLSASEAFFIRVPDNGLVLSAAGHKANIAGFDASVGFLDVTFGDGTANSKIDLDADVNVRFTNSEVNADGKITLSELQGTELANLVTQLSTGTLGVNLPTKATLGSFTPNGVVAIADANLFDVVAPVTTLTGPGSGDMLKFNNIGSGQMLALADELGSFLNSLQAQDVLKFDVPFVKGENLSALDDFGSLFAAKLTSDVASNGLRQLVHPANPDGTGEVLPNTPSFASAQELATKLATALGLSEATVAANFNTATGELTYHIKLATSATENRDARRPGYRRAAGRHDQQPGRADRSRHPRFHLRHQPVAGRTGWNQFARAALLCQGRGARGEHHDVVADPHRRFRPFRTRRFHGRAERLGVIRPEEEPEGPDDVGFAGRA